MIKTIIFDWSGVISDDLTQAYEAAMYIFKDFGAKQMTKEEFRDAFFLPYMDFYVKYIPRAIKEKIDSLFTEALKVVTAPKIYSGVKEVLKTLKEKQVKMFVLSTHPQKEILKEIEEYELGDMFEKIYGSVQDKRDILTKLIEENNLDKNEIIFVGDMVHDIEAAKSVGIKIAVVSYGYDSKEKLEEHKPDFILNKFEDIKKLI